MKVEWKSPKMTSPVIPKGKSSVCVMVTPGDGLASHPMKAWYNSDGNYWLANSGEKADVEGWDYYPCHM